MAKSLTIKNRNNEILYTKTVSSLVYDNDTGNTVKHDLDNLIGQVAELQGVENAFFGGILQTSNDIITDYSNNEYEGVYLYMVGSDMSSLVAYQYAGSGSPTQLFNGTTYDFTDYSEVKQDVADLELEIEDINDVLESSIVVNTLTQTINITSAGNTIPQKAESQTCDINWGTIEQHSIPGFTNIFTTGSFPMTRTLLASKVQTINANAFGDNRVLNNVYLYVYHFSSVDAGLYYSSDWTLLNSNGESTSFSGSSDCWVFFEQIFTNTGNGTNPKFTIQNNTESSKTCINDYAYCVDLTVLNRTSDSLDSIINDYGFLHLIPGQNYGGTSGTVILTSEDSEGTIIDTATYPSDNAITVVGGGTISLSGNATPSIVVEWNERQLAPGRSDVQTAEQISYSNTTSGLLSTNVQNAIDETATLAELAKTTADEAIVVAENASGGALTAFQRNRHRGSVLFSQGFYFTMSGGKTYRLPQFLIITDNHGTGQCIDNAFSIANGFDSIMGIFQLGDLCAAIYDSSYASNFASKLETKPVYSIIGNHDVGNSNVIANCATREQLYNSFIKPMVDKGWLANGEYIVNESYWYHDISYYDKSANAERKIRLIGINQYDYPDTSDTINTSDNTQFKFTKGRSYIGETQANWLKSLLLSVEPNMAIIILVHQSIFATSASTGRTSLAFCDNTDYNNVYSLQSTDVVYSLLTAWLNKSSGSVTINTNANAGEALANYTINYDFTNREETAVLCPVLAGHSHRDRIDVSNSIVQLRSINSGKHDTFGDIYHGRPISENGTMNGYITDDCLNVITIDSTNKKIKLCKLGATYTINGYLREQEEFLWESLIN